MLLRPSSFSRTSKPRSSHWRQPSLHLPRSTGLTDLSHWLFLGSPGGGRTAGSSCATLGSRSSCCRSAGCSFSHLFQGRPSRPVHWRASFPSGIETWRRADPELLFGSSATNVKNTGNKKGGKPSSPSLRNALSFRLLQRGPFLSRLMYEQPRHVAQARLRKRRMNECEPSAVIIE